MNVRDLNEEQLNELRESYYHQLLDNDNEVLEGIRNFHDISDEIIFNHYDDISFVDDDFFCSLTLA